jgi:hypothetical protein
MALRKPLGRWEKKLHERRHSRAVEDFEKNAPDAGMAGREVGASARGDVLRGHGYVTLNGLFVKFRRTRPGSERRVAEGVFDDVG